MAAPAIGVRATWAPLNASVDWSHPLAAGLGAFLLPTHDLVTARRTTMNSFVHGPGGPYGRTIAGSALTGATGSSVAIADSMFTSAAGCTIMMAARRTTTVGYQYFGTKGSSLTASNPVAIRTEGGGNPESPTFFRSNAGGAWKGHFPSSSAAALTPGQWFVFGATFADNLMQTVPTVIVNGAVFTTMTGIGTGTGAVAGSGYDWMIGSRPDTSSAAEQSSVEWSFCAVWARALTIPELQAMTADPFCFLRR